LLPGLRHAFLGDYPAPMVAQPDLLFVGVAAG
jgi:hypothetical protein